MRVDRAKRTIGKWLTAAAMAFAASLAFAHPPHGGGMRGGGGYGAAHRDLAHGWHGESGGPRARPSGVNASGARWGLRPSQAALPSAMPAYRGGVPAGLAYGAANGRYLAASPYRSVSASSSSLPRSSGSADGAMRSGSIRADVARYNEERGGRPPAPRGQDNDGSRGTFFSSFYRNN
ncbi:hypothetical protein [Burkholderia plantarii]|uniref:hypothetical protein n=1 Tax=Burkholderia plantarii TaxID=41899 RepID=UPI0018DC8456|nr:hypothetical protein [Burkholderia plantarii]MBI0327127.1 hypothetical protein [Burkholderia plantarii]